MREVERGARHNWRRAEEQTALTGEQADGKFRVANMVGGIAWSPCEWLQGAID